MITIGSTITIIKGCRALDITAPAHARVTDIRELGADYSHAVAVTFTVTSGFKSGKSFKLYARHINRLSDPTTNLNDGNPLHKITVRAR